MPDNALNLIVIGGSGAFAEVWPALAARLELGLRLFAEPEPVRQGRSVAVVLNCGGEEDRAVDYLHQAHRAGVEVPLVIGAEADHRLAMELMRRGAGGYYAFPDDLERLVEELEGRLSRLSAEPDDEALEEFQRRSYDFSSILGDDASLRDALDRAARVIPGGKATVLLTGETGTGKELLAQAIHYNGPRARNPFVAVNCSAIPASLLESELFGHEKGAFTNAHASKPGLFEVADGGTLFLDEVAILPLELQGKLLRVLETMEVRRVGGVQEKKVDVRIIAAANVGLPDLIRDGSFREDLYYRLAVVPIHLPALRERGDDVERLTHHFLAALADEYGVEPPEFARGALEAIRRHRWPGNVRELRNAVERALLLSGGAAIRPDHLALEGVPGAGGQSESVEAGGEGRLPFPATLDQIERAAARAAIERCGGNKSEAARLLGTTRTRLYRLLRDDE
jgi:DNA-binding NtrC family response regulator